MNWKKFNGFSLMEMMVVLLIVAIVLAATAPMISRKVVGGGGAGEGGCKWTQLDERHIGYNVISRPTDDSNFLNEKGIQIGGRLSPFSFGTTALARRITPKILLVSDAGRAPHITLTGDSRLLSENSDPSNMSIMVNPSGNGFAIRQEVARRDTDGYPAGVLGEDALSIGSGTGANNIGSIAIGKNAFSSGNYAIAIGSTKEPTPTGGFIEPEDPNIEPVEHPDGELIDYKYGNYTLASLIKNTKNKINSILTVAKGSPAHATDVTQYDEVYGGHVTIAPNSEPDEPTPDNPDNDGPLSWQRTKALGDSAIAIGRRSYSYGSCSIAIGPYSNAAESSSLAIGSASKALGRFTTSVGGTTKASGNWSASMGFQTSAEGDCSVALGTWARAAANDSIAIGVADIASRHIGTYGTDSIAIGASNTKAYGNRSVAIGSGVKAGSGTNQQADPNIVDCTAVGYHAEASGNATTAYGSEARALYAYSTAVGYKARAEGSSASAYGVAANANGDFSTAIGRGTHSGSHAIALGRGANANGMYSIAIGTNDEGTTCKTKALGPRSIAVGYNAQTSSTAERSVAIGSGASATASSSVAIGPGASATQEKQIVLGQTGTNAPNVYIRGNLFVDGNINQKSGNNYQTLTVGAVGNGTLYWGPYSSDRRLKNVGEVYKAGIAELKKLEFFHYTFKDDKNKTPRVGVIAQDLQKIFPDAVIKGEDGFLRIRMEDMFYAVVNAVKELDSRLTALSEQVKSNMDLTAKLQAKINAQQKEIAELKKLNSEFEKRLSKLEKKVK